MPLVGPCRHQTLTTCCETSTLHRVRLRLHTLPHVTSSRTYDYEQLVARIEAVLGERPSTSALRAAAAQQRRTANPRTKARLTAGMPPPLPATSRTSPARFDAEEIESWLASHPRLAWQQATEQARDGLRHGGDTEQVIAQALRAGLSWRTITALLIEHDGRPRTMAGVHKHYRHLQTPTS